MDTIPGEVTPRELRGQLSDVLGRAMYGGERIGVTCNGKLAAVVVGVTYLVEFTTAAARQLRTIDRPVRLRLITAIEGLAEHPRQAGATKLVGEETAWRIRVGDHRFIYDVLEEALVVTVARADHRREVYDR